MGWPQKASSPKSFFMGKYSMTIISFHYRYNSITNQRTRELSSERLSNLSKVTQPVSGRTRIQTQVCMLQIHTLCITHRVCREESLQTLSLHFSILYSGIILSLPTKQLSMQTLTCRQQCNESSLFAHFFLTSLATCPSICS